MINETEFLTTYYKTTSPEQAQVLRENRKRELPADEYKVLEEKLNYLDILRALELEINKKDESLELCEQKKSQLASDATLTLMQEMPATKAREILNNKNELVKKYIEIAKDCQRSGIHPDVIKGSLQNIKENHSELQRKMKGYISGAMYFYSAAHSEMKLIHDKYKDLLAKKQGTTNKDELSKINKDIATLEEGIKTLKNFGEKVKKKHESVMVQIQTRDASDFILKGVSQLFGLRHIQEKIEEKKFNQKSASDEKNQYDKNITPIIRKINALHKAVTTEYTQVNSSEVKQKLSILNSILSEQSNPSSLVESAPENEMTSANSLLSQYPRHEKPSISHGTVDNEKNEKDVEKDSRPTMK